ncbi:MAG: biotin/lipoyl-containing protein [Chloroflexota bacterium]
MAQERIEFPIPGKVIGVNVRQGGVVKEGDVICTLESMKMENPIVSPVDGTVVEIKLTPGQVVESGDLVAIIEY